MSVPLPVVMPTMRAYELAVFLLYVVVHSSTRRTQFGSRNPTVYNVNSRRRHKASLDTSKHTVLDFLPVPVRFPSVEILILHNNLTVLGEKRVSDLNRLMLFLPVHLRILLLDLTLCPVPVV